MVWKTKTELQVERHHAHSGGDENWTKMDLSSKTPRSYCMVCGINATHLPIMWKVLWEAAGKEEREARQAAAERYLVDVATQIAEHLRELEGYIHHDQG